MVASDWDGKKVEMGNYCITGIEFQFYKLKSSGHGEW